MTLSDILMLYLVRYLHMLPHYYIPFCTLHSTTPRLSMVLHWIWYKIFQLPLNSVWNGLLPLLHSPSILYQCCRLQCSL